MLQNRVDPFGRILATPARGTLMGNRGILHDATGRLGTARWRRRAWVTCRLAFRGRHRQVMSPGRYTELFFLDEATALAAGHRPCAECRRADYLAFRHAWQRATGQQPSAGAMDRVLHQDRVRRDRSQVTHVAPLATLPEGAMAVMPDGGDALLWWVGRLWPWSFAGYGSPIRVDPMRSATVLTPRMTIAVLSQGYRPEVHASLHASS